MNLSFPRKAQSVIALVSFFILVGHKGDCGTTITTECPAILNPVCGQDGVTYGNSCHANEAGIELAHQGECDAACPPGEHIETICEDGGYEDGTTATSGTGGDGSLPPPYQGECYDVCVADSPCGPGYHEELICEGSSVAVGSGGAGGESSSVTVGVGGAGAGGADSTTVTVGQGGGGDPMQPPYEECYLMCVEDYDGDYGTSSVSTGSTGSG